MSTKYTYKGFYVTGFLSCPSNEVTLEFPFRLDVF